MRISYKDKVDGQKWYGERVDDDNDFLCITKKEGVYWIYKTIQGEPFLRVRITDRDVAIRFGQLLHQWYGNYLWIWKDKEWVDADIPSLTKYTIPNGVAVYEALMQIVSLKVVANLNNLEGVV